MMNLRILSFVIFSQLVWVNSIKFTLSKLGEDDIVGSSFDEIREIFGENGVLDFSDKPELREEERQIGLKLFQDPRVDVDKSYQEMTDAEKEKIFPIIMGYYQNLFYRIAKLNGYKFTVDFDG